MRRRRRRWVHALAIHAARRVDHEKTVARVSNAMHACVYGAPRAWLLCSAIMFVVFF